VARPTSTARRELGTELRRLRGDRRAAGVAAGLGWSESKLSRIETAHTGITEADLDRLLTAYGVRVEDRDRLRELARRGRARAWWTPYRSSVPDPYDEYVALEADAVQMCEWEAQVVPGLLQTDEYARAVIEVGADIEDTETIQRRVALRMARQAVLTRDPPPTLQIILDEAVLHREVGGREVLCRQLLRLLDASHRPDVELLILPFSAGAHAGQTEAFMVLEFAEGTRNPVVHIEGLTGGLFRVTAAEVEVYQDAFDDLRERALSAEQSRTAIAETVDAIRSRAPSCAQMDTHSPVEGDDHATRQSHLA
jgi:transcriptional regulator with XRE-family HTH domain